MNVAVVSIGSNISPDVNVKKACERLNKEFVVRSVSSFVRTKPLGGVQQSDFTNGVIMLEVDLDIETLKARLKLIEVELGRRERDNKWGPREIDLDVLIWNGQVVDRDYYERDFLQNAVREILPGLKLRCA
jgi:2-amino-4-hydroxy-6-hydroxymethyldihydropteridine diphosphokinase